MSVSMRSMLSRAAITALVLLLAEATLGAVMEHGHLATGLPTLSLANATSDFYDDYNPDFGVWHLPNRTHRHRTAGFDVTYASNSYGARDRERPLHARGDRVVVLGDSFMEGYAVADGVRMSDRLERATGIEHLNFATSGTFGPTQYYLVYKTLAKKFDHTRVLLGLLPDNDFLDDDLAYGMEHYHDRYRPYFRGESPHCELVYFQPTLSSHHRRLAHVAGGVLREFTYSYHAASDLVTHARSWTEGAEQTYSGYDDFEEAQRRRLARPLAAEGRGRRSARDGVHHSALERLPPRSSWTGRLLVRRVTRESGREFRAVGSSTCR